MPVDRSGYHRYLTAQVAALMIVLVSIGAVVAIPMPFSPVPIVLQNAFVVLTGVLLAPGWAIATVLLYLVLGAAGLPIFAGATGGIPHLVGPSAGYLWSYPVAAAIPSLILRGGFRGTAKTALGRSVPILAAALLAGFLVPYPLGTFWLSHVLELSYLETIPIGVVPFLPLDGIKLVALVFVLRILPESVWKSFV